MIYSNVYVMYTAQLRPRCDIHLVQDAAKINLKNVLFYLLHFLSGSLVDNRSIAVHPKSHEKW